MATKRVYPDTNVALHYRPFEELDWCELVGADEVVLVVTSVFLREIEDHKDRSRGQLQARARRVSKWIGDRDAKQRLRNDVRLELSVREPELDVDFAAAGLVATVNDDKFIACMLRDRKKTENEIVCVTSDVLLRIKAREAGFDVAEPPWPKLPDEPDAAEQENRQLRQKLIELERRVAPEPELAIRFAGNQRHTTLRLSGLTIPSSEEIELELSSELNMLESTFRYSSSILRRPPSAQAIAQYIDSLREWMQDVTPLAQKRAHTCQLQLELANAGTANASDISVELSFPSNVFVAERRRLPAPPKLPERPKTQDLTALVGARAFLDFKRAHDLSFLDRASVGRQPVRLFSDAADEHAIEVDVDAIKHQSVLALPAFDLWFAPGALPTGFQIKYRIHAASTPKIAEGAIDVQVNAIDSAPSLLRMFMKAPPESPCVTDDEVSAILDDAQDVPDE